MQGSFQGTGKKEKPPQQHKARQEQINPLDLARAPGESDTPPILFSQLETWELLPLSHPLVTPTTSTSVQDNTELTSPTGCRALLGLNQYKSPVFFLHTIRTLDAQTLITRWC
jgi:hypothetical protein